MKKLLFMGMFSLMFSNNAHALTVSWDRNLESDVCKYKVYLCSSYDKASRLKADVAGPHVVENPCICCDQVDWDVYWVNHDFVFIAVTAIDSRQIESEPTIAYFLYGNICDTYNNDETSYTEAAVDSSDFDLIMTHLGKTDVTHQQINCDVGFALIIPSDTQMCDIDRDGDVDCSDMSEFMERLGNTID